MNAPIDAPPPSRRQLDVHAAFLALEDGSVFHGTAFGARQDAVGEVVFNTGMSGYQEIITDPSYAGQIVTLTSPEIGNYGCNPQDAESRGVFLNGLIVHDLNPPSNFRSTQSLDTYMREHGRSGLAGVETRALTLHIRRRGNLRGFLHAAPRPMTVEEGIGQARAWEGLDNQDYAARVSTREPYVWHAGGDRTVVVMDFGVKHNTLRRLAAAGCKTIVVPARTTAAEVLAHRPDGVLLSNGPADPAALDYAVATIRELLGKVPLMGICLGHQLLGLACGAACGRLRFGHHGCNHPVRNLGTGAVEITSQNHNFTLRDLPAALLQTHVNLNDGTIEGIRHRHCPAFAVQYHPEAAPGPRDAQGHFDSFRKMMAGQA